MDENYTSKEKSIILKALPGVSYKKESDFKIVFKEAKKGKSIQSNFRIYKRDKKKSKKIFKFKILEI